MSDAERAGRRSVEAGTGREEAVVPWSVEHVGVGGRRSRFRRKNQKVISVITQHAFVDRANNVE